jgi:hypothetical protein
VSKPKDPIKDVEPPRPEGQQADGAPAPDYQKLFHQLVARANGGDPEALRRLRIFLDKNPWLWQRAGDLSAVAERSWIDLICGTNQLVAESVKRQIARLKKDLAGDDPTAIERVLVEHLAACYLAVQHAEIQAASPPGGSLEQAGFRLKRAESSQKRLLQATKTLATLRALVPGGLLPSSQMKAFAPEHQAG